MNKLSAASIMRVIAALDQPMAELGENIAALPASPDRDRMGQALGDIMDLLTTRFVSPVIQKFPDLDPDR